MLGCGILSFRTKQEHRDISNITIGEDYHNLCRLCLKESSLKVNIFDDEGTKCEVQRLAQDCLSLTISEGDKLPKCLCQPCLEKLVNFQEFKEFCQESEHVLKTLISEWEQNAAQSKEDICTDFEQPNIDDCEPEEVVVYSECDLQEAKEVTVQSYESEKDVESTNNFLDSKGVIYVHVNNDSVVGEVEVVLADDTSQQAFIHNAVSMNSTSATSDIEPVPTEYQTVEFVEVEEVVAPNNEVFVETSFHSPVESSRIETNEEGQVSSEVYSDNETRTMQWQSVTQDDASSNINIHASIHQEAQSSVCGPYSQPCQNLCGAKVLDMGGQLICAECSQMNNHTPCDDQSNSGKNMVNELSGGFARCDECSKLFLDRNRLYRHIRVHNGDKPFSCEVCFKRFREKHHLTRHLRIHTGEKPYTCEVCARGFADKGNLDRHMKIH